MAVAVASSGTVSAAPHELNGFCSKNEPLLCAATNRIDPPPGGSLLLLAHVELIEMKKLRILQHSGEMQIGYGDFGQRKR
jgi:hypothetical protein